MGRVGLGLACCWAASVGGPCPQEWAQVAVGGPGGRQGVVNHGVWHFTELLAPSHILYTVTMATLAHYFNECRRVEVVCSVELNDGRQVREALVPNQELVATATHNVVAHFCVLTAQGGGEGRGGEGRRGESKRERGEGRERGKRGTAEQSRVPSTSGAATTGYTLTVSSHCTCFLTSQSFSIKYIFAFVHIRRPNKVYPVTFSACNCMYGLTCSFINDGDKLKKKKKKGRGRGGGERERRGGEGWRGKREEGRGGVEGRRGEGRGGEEGKEREGRGNRAHVL